MTCNYKSPKLRAVKLDLGTNMANSLIPSSGDGKSFSLDKNAYGEEDA